MADDPENQEGETASSPPPTQAHFHVCMLEDGTGSIFYPSGRVAVTVTGGSVGRHSLFMDDDRKSTIVGSFDPEGVGCINYRKTGAPWVVVTKKGYTVSDEQGTFTENVTWPRSNPNPIICDLNKYMRFSFKDRREMTVTFQGDAEPIVFECGEVQRRSDSYLEKVNSKKQGKCELDVSDIRGERFFATAKSNHIYHPLLERPSALDRNLTMATLTEGLKRMQDVELHGMADSLSSTQSRLMMTNSLPIPLYGTNRTHGSSSPALGATKSSTGESPGTTMRAGELPPLELTKQQKKMLASLYKINPNSPPVNYKMKRKRIQQVRVKDLDNFILTAPKETLIVVCCMGTWNPLCHKLMPMLEEVSFAIEDKVIKAFNESSLKSSNPDSKPQDPDQMIVQVDLAESKLLNERYHFKTVPMMLCFYENRLVHASNTMRDKDSIFEQIDKAYKNAKGGHFLPNEFKFQGITHTDNAILEACM